MGREKISSGRRFLSVSASLAVIALCSSPLLARGAADADDDGGSEGGNQAATQLFAQLLYSQVSNFTSVFRGDIAKNFGFCIQDV